MTNVCLCHWSSASRVCSLKTSRVWFLVVFRLESHFPTKQLCCTCQTWSYIQRAIVRFRVRLSCYTCLTVQPLYIWQLMQSAIWENVWSQQGENINWFPEINKNVHHFMCKAILTASALLQRAVFCFRTNGNWIRDSPRSRLWFSSNLQ